jgi:hypothetical protein
LSDEIERRLGRFIALGNPRDVLPPGGALRVYVASADWREQVKKLALAASVILMQPDVSSAVQFELELIRRVDCQTRFFVVTAPTIWRIYDWYWKVQFRLCGWRAPSWEAFAEQLRVAGFLDVGADPGPGAVVSFDANGRRVDLVRGCTRPRQYVDAIMARLGHL